MGSSDPASTTLPVALSVSRGLKPARTWRVSLTPEQVVDAVANGSSSLVTRAVSKDHWASGLRHDGTVFIERAQHGIKLWRRPPGTWAFSHSLVARPAPFPDVLCLEAREDEGGSVLTATWTAHPATRRANVAQTAIGLFLVSVAVLTLSTTSVVSLIFWSAAAISFTVGVAQQRRQLRRDRSSLLAGLHVPLAPHELEAGPHPGYRQALVEADRPTPKSGA